MATSPDLQYATFVSEGLPSGQTLPPSGQTLPDGQPWAWSPTTATLIHGTRDALLVDPPFLTPQLDEIESWIRGTGLTLTGIYVTHAHGDHWYGAPELSRRFGGIPVHASQGTIDLMPPIASEQGRRFYEFLYPGLVPDAPVTAQPVPTRGLTLEGHDLRVLEVGHSDGDSSTVLHAPSIGLVVAGDVAYDGVHQYLAEGGDGGLDSWLHAIDAVRALEPRAVVASHARPGSVDDPRILDDTETYLRTALRLLEEAPDADTFTAGLVAAYPDRLNRSVPWLSGRRLYGEQG